MNNRIAFVLAATQHGSMIVNRLDAHFKQDGSGGYGVGLSLLEQGHYEWGEIGIGARLLESRRAHFGDGVVAFDCGANIGTHSIPWAMLMRGWGSVVAIEAQERVFYALAGNIALNNCFNAKAVWGLVGRHKGAFRMPRLDHQQMASFGSVEALIREDGAPAEDVGQVVSAYGTVEGVTLDNMCGYTLGNSVADRVDLIKLDIEGMELAALRGASVIVCKYHPVLIVEWLKVGMEPLVAMLDKWGYKTFPFGMNLVAVHETDPTLENFYKGFVP